MNYQPKRIAIIGGGVSGLSAAYFLDENPDYEITLYEKENKLGGNARTVIAKTSNGQPYAVDPIAYLFITKRYPYFSAWIKQLGVKTLPLTFENYLWNAHKGKGMLITSNLFKILRSPGKSWNYLWNLFLFSKVIKTIDKLDAEGKLTDELLMKDFVKEVPFITKNFLEEVFYPLMSFAFHVDVKLMPDQPCGTTLRSYSICAKDTKGGWCIDGGVQTYIRTVQDQLQRTSIKLDDTVKSISLNKNSTNTIWKVTTSKGDTQEYDQIILALWPHQAAEVLKNGSNDSNMVFDETIKLLSHVELAWCRAIVHNDSKVMPLNKFNWGTYCYKYIPYIKTIIASIWSGQAKNEEVFTSYDWGNHEDEVSSKNALTKPAEPFYSEHIHVRTPPRLSLYEAQKHIFSRQGLDGLWFSNSFLRNTGFHEDGLATTIEVINTLVTDSSKRSRLDSLIEAAGFDKDTTL